MKKFLIYMVLFTMFFAGIVYASSPKRFTDGVTNVGSSTTMGQFLAPDPTKTFGFFDDFYNYDTLAANKKYVVTTVEGGDQDATELISDTYRGGALVISNDTTDNDYDAFQLSKDGGTNDSELFYCTTGYKLWFKTKFQVNSATQCDIMVGIHIADTNPFSTEPSDGIYFRKDDGDTNIDIVSVKNSVTAGSSGIATLSANTDIILGFYWDGIETITYYVNDVEKGSFEPGTSLPDDEYLPPSFCFQNGEANDTTKTMTIDYIGCWQER